MKKCFSISALTIAACLLIAAVSVFFCTEKAGYFLDEIYSYTLSNDFRSEEQRDAPPFDLSSGGTVVSGEEFTDHLTVNENERFRYASVYRNQITDVHPPLYYFFLHTLSSLFFVHTFSKWTGLLLNLVFFALTLFFLYKLVYRLYQSRYRSLLAILFYGLCQLGLSTMLMIRMYMLLTLCTVLLAYFIVCHMHSENRAWDIGIFLTIYAGMLTQYYFVIYAFLVCAAYCLYMLLKKQYKKLFRFAVSALLGVGVMFASFPYCYDQMFLQDVVSADTTLRNAKNIAGWLPRFKTFIQYALPSYAPIVAVLLIVFLFRLIKKRKLRFTQDIRSSLTESAVLSVPAIAAFIITAIISPYLAARYIYNLVPILFIPFLFCFSLLSDEDGPEISRTVLRRGAACVLILSLLLSAGCLYKKHPDYIFRGRAAYEKTVEAHRDSACIQLAGNSEGISDFVSCYSNLPELRYFNDIFLTDEFNGESIRSYLDTVKPSDSLLVFTDGHVLGEEFCADFVRQLSDSFGFTDIQRINKNDFSEAYLLTRGEQ